MKKLILAAACAAFATASFAQVDTTKAQTQPPVQTQPSQSDKMRNDNMQGWTRVESADVPTTLRQSLSADNQYRGWETGTVYRNEAGDIYSLRTSGEKGKTYYFDKNGKAVKKPNDK